MTNSGIRTDGISTIKAWLKSMNRVELERKLLRITTLYEELEQFTSELLQLNKESIQHFDKKFAEYQRELSAFKEARRRGGKARHAKSAKDKKCVFELWKEWDKNGRPEYRSQAAFARMAIDHISSIEDPRTIERWCKNWNKEKKQSAG